MQSLDGTLFIYHPEKRLVSFEYSPHQPSLFSSLSLSSAQSPSPPSVSIILIGGLTDGLLGLPYTTKLAQFITSSAWADAKNEPNTVTLIQPILTSSYSGYGISSLAQDTEELSALVKQIVETDRGSDAERSVRKIVLLGHSTGSQNCIHFLNHSTYRDYVQAAILQGNVSDREYLQYALGEDSLASYLGKAAALIQSGASQELMPRECDPSAPITAYRFHSLAARE
jgi:hypothetical protein